MAYRWGGSVTLLKMNRLVEGYRSTGGSGRAFEELQVRKLFFHPSKSSRFTTLFCSGESGIVSTQAWFAWAVNLGQNGWSRSEFHVSPTIETAKTCQDYMLDVGMYLHRQVFRSNSLCSSRLRGLYTVRGMMYLYCHVYPSLDYIL